MTSGPSGSGSTEFGIDQDKTVSARSWRALLRRSWRVMRYAIRARADYGEDASQDLLMSHSRGQRDVTTRHPRSSPSMPPAIQHHKLNVLRVASFVLAVLPACSGGGEGGPTNPLPPGPPGPPVPSPAAMSVFAGESQVIHVGTSVWVRPAVRVVDAAGAALGNVDVSFTVTAGQGTITGASVKTDASGVATVGGWTVGASAGENRVTAQVASLSPVVFTASATEPADGKTDLLAGSAGYTGTWPKPTRVGFVSAGQTIQINAYPTQIQLFFDPGTTEAAAHALIRTQGSTVLSQLPRVGYYLVEVKPGTESSFITAISADPIISTANPHALTMYGRGPARVATPAPIGSSTSAAPPPIMLIDHCGAGNHGGAVSRAGIAGGGVMGECFDDGSGKPREAVLDKTIRHLVTIGVTDPGKDRLLSITTYGGIQDENGNDLSYFSLDDAGKARARNSWLTTARMFVEAVAQLPSDKRHNLVIGLCAGNNDTPIGSGIASLRQDPRYATVLKDNFLIVGASESAFEHANDAPGDPDFARMADASSDIPSQRGCSFATPRALAMVQKVIGAHGVSARDALTFAKGAIAANNRGELIESEALGYAAPKPVTIETFGTGTGAVDPYGTGTKLFPRGKEITLTARATGSSVFEGWISLMKRNAAPCSGSNTTCTFIVNDTTKINASFGSGAPPPRITSVSPGSPIGSASPQPFTISGTGFAQGAEIGLINLRTGHNFRMSPSSVSSTQIVINPNFGTDGATWILGLGNPDGQYSSEFRFVVQTPTNAIRDDTLFTHLRILAPFSEISGGGGGRAPVETGMRITVRATDERAGRPVGGVRLAFVAIEAFDATGTRTYGVQPICTHAIGSTVFLTAHGRNPDVPDCITTGNSLTVVTTADGIASVFWPAAKQPGIPGRVFVIPVAFIERMGMGGVNSAAGLLCDSGTGFASGPWVKCTEFLSHTVPFDRTDCYSELGCIPSVPAGLRPGTAADPGPKLVWQPPWDTLRVTYTWDASRGTQGYQFWVRRRTIGFRYPNGSDLVDDWSANHDWPAEGSTGREWWRNLSIGTDGTSRTETSPFLSFGEYRWTVRACNAAGCSPPAPERYFRVSALVPVITTVSPNALVHTGLSTDIRIYGNNFVHGSILQLRDLTRGTPPQDVPFTFVISSTELKVSLSLNPGSFAFQVLNPDGISRAASNLFNITVK